MGLSDIEWDDGYEDPLENDPELRRKFLRGEPKVNTVTIGPKPWGTSTTVAWGIGLLFALIWAVPWSLVAAAILIGTVGIGFPLALLPWSIGCAPATLLINARLRNGTRDTVLIDDDDLATVTTKSN